MKKPLTMPEEAQPRNITRADLVLTEGFGLEVDGRMKTVFPTLQAAEKKARALKAEFPMLQIKVYDAAEKTRTLVFGLEACTRINVPTSLALNEVASSSSTSGCHSRASRTASDSVNASPTSATSPLLINAARSRYTGLSRGAQESVLMIFICAPSPPILSTGWTCPSAH